MRRTRTERKREKCAWINKEGQEEVETMERSWRLEVKKGVGKERAWKGEWEMREVVMRWR